MNGPFGQENRPPALPRLVPSLLPREILSGSSAGKEATHPGSKHTTHSPASAPTKNIPVVLPNTLIALPQGSLRDNRCPAPTHHSQFLDFIVCNHSGSLFLRTELSYGALV